MDRSVGSWRSARRYLFGDKRNSGEYVTEFDIESTDLDNYKITWSGKTDGVMEVFLEGDKLNRSRSYFNPDDSETYQRMTRIDDDCVVFETAYDGSRFREEIRFLDDNFRLRQTVGWDIETGKIDLIGQYAEDRIG